MKISDIYSGQLLKAADVIAMSEKDRRQVIVSVIMVRFEDGPKPVANFESGLSMSLGKQNATLLAKAYGDDTDSWIDRAITLSTEKINFRGKKVDSIVVSPADETVPY